MPKPWIAVQLPMDGSSSAPAHDVERRLSRARELAQADAVILRPGGDPALAARATAVARRLGMEAILWFPVFADAPVAAPSNGRVTRNADGSDGHGRSGAWRGLSGGQESFLFHCPNDPRAVPTARAALEKLLDALDVNGVMLDKVRFPGPSNGFEALFCCFCESCSAAFQGATGRSMEDARRRSVAFLSRLRSDGPAALAGWTPASAFWTACGLEDLADFRFHSITAAVRELAEAARARSLAVGLDLFSPSLAPLVGQDYGALGSLCDWVKPMTYRFAAGPAGLPLEIASLWGALGTLGPRTGEGGARSVLERALGFELPASEEDLLRRGLPASVISSELDSVARAGPKAGAKVYAGIEAVQIPRFGIRVRPPDVQASVRAAMQAEAGRVDGVILSWDLMAIPDENLRAAAEAVQ